MAASLNFVIEKHGEWFVGACPEVGFAKKLSQTHPGMVLAIPYFEAGDLPIIRHVAFMPFCMLRPHSKGWRTEPAKLVKGRAAIRGDHSRCFDQQGLSRLDDPAWSTVGLRGGRE